MVGKPTIILQWSFFISATRTDQYFSIIKNKIIRTANLTGGPDLNIFENIININTYD
ncbi:hypothetical protein GCM10008914_22870 [Clostridium tertium]